MPASVCWTWAYSRPCSWRCDSANDRTRRPSTSGASAIGGAASSATKAKPGSSVIIATVTLATVTTAASGVSSSSSSTVCTDQLSPATRSIVSPTGSRICSRSERRWTRANMSRATSNTVPWPTTVHRYVLATSSALVNANTMSSASATQISSP